MKVGIVGAGIFGMAAAMELRRRGHSVTLFDQGEVPYENASSTDVSKAIRRTWYGDDDSYVELVERAASQWRAWEKRSGMQVYHQVGQLVITASFEPGTPMHESVKYLRERGAQIEVLSGKQAGARFPQFAIRDCEVCIHDAWGGYIESGRAVSCLAGLAREDGVDIVERAPVSRVEDASDGAIVALPDRTALFDRVVVAAGVWTGRLLPELAEHVRVTHQQMVLIEVEDAELFGPGRMPVWSVDPDTGGWYGFPVLREGYAKVSLEPVGEPVDPDLDRQGTAEFADQTLEFLRERLPEMAKGKVVGGRSCLYANTPDDHFVIDRAPGYRRVLAAGGGSGHGFKFGGSIGEVIADTVEERDSPLGALFRIGERFGPLAQPRGSHETRGFALPGRRADD